MKNNLVIAALLNEVESISVPVKIMDNDWTSTSYLQGDWLPLDYDVKPGKLYVSGFFNGAMVANNLFALHNDAISGVGILNGGGPCVTRHSDEDACDGA